MMRCSVAPHKYRTLQRQTEIRVENIKNIEYVDFAYLLRQMSSFGNGVVGATDKYKQIIKRVKNLIRNAKNIWRNNL